MRDEPGREVRGSFDWTDAETVSAAVVAAVGSVAGKSATELPPLYDAVDPDALDALFDRANGDGQLRTVAFSFDGHRVVLEASGEGHLFD